MVLELHPGQGGTGGIHVPTADAQGKLQHASMQRWTGALLGDAAGCCMPRTPPYAPRITSRMMHHASQSFEVSIQTYPSGRDAIREKAGSGVRSEFPILAWLLLRVCVFWREG